MVGSELTMAGGCNLWVDQESCTTTRQHGGGSPANDQEREKRHKRGQQPERLYSMHQDFYAAQHTHIRG